MNNIRLDWELGQHQIDCELEQMKKRVNTPDFKEEIKHYLREVKEVKHCQVNLDDDVEFVKEKLALSKIMTHDLDKAREQLVELWVLLRRRERQLLQWEQQLRQQK